MQNNDIIRRIRYIFDFSDTKMIALFELVNYKTSRFEVSNWLKKEGDDDYQDMKDRELATFLNGLIIDKRGKKEGPQPEPETRLNNNIILRKLKIALNFKDQDMLDILKLADMKISKHELSALFRSPKQNQYRECHDQLLRNFLHGLQLNYRQYNQ